VGFFGWLKRRPLAWRLRWDRWRMASGAKEGRRADARAYFGGVSREGERCQGDMGRCGRKAVTERRALVRANFEIAEPAKFHRTPMCRRHYSQLRRGGFL
jgi:hypothetical protein